QHSKEALAATVTGLRERGTTVLMVLHELGTFETMLHRAVVLRHGAVVHDGAPPRPAPGHDHPDHEHPHPHSDEPPLDPRDPELAVALRSARSMSGRCSPARSCSVPSSRPSPSGSPRRSWAPTWSSGACRCSVTASGTWR